MMFISNIKLEKLTEDDLYQLLVQKIYPNLTRTEDIFGRIDCYDKDTNAHIELKCRYEHFPFLIIEKDKYQQLIVKDNPFYCCSTPKGIYLFELNKLEEPIWRTKYLPKTTEFTNTEFIEKEIGELPVSQAIELTQLFI